jgi:hypothetical protein
VGHLCLAKVFCVTTENVPKEILKKDLPDDERVDIEAKGQISARR